MPVTEVAAGSLRKVLDLATPQSVVAVAEQRRGDLASVLGDARGRGRPVLALVGIQDPGNAGTLVRVAEASGCAGVAFTEGSVDPWNPKAVRATAGALLRIPVCEGVVPAELIELAVQGDTLVAMVARGGVNPEEVDLGGAAVLLVGSEAHGLPDEVFEAAPTKVSIPMEGHLESLNAAVSGALLGFEAARQRRDAKPVDLLRGHPGPEC
ncbi:MAG: RNA methyltransferase [Microthrixaceae bacterium]|nr:RNA methyltransferase [Microthrixaceae bacterium]